MDLFQLLGKISIDNKEAVDALNETSKTGEKAESKLGKVFKGVGKGAVVAGKVIGAGMLAGATAVGTLVTKSIQSYADYEQLVGGVETLFKESAQKVQEYAANAYKTAGLSANEYMETVTSFSASLLQSLEGDTNEAAEKANMAITDMSDNANKMGTDMALIQNAYNGFAKANFTMLDNLKLGYGGTKEEMARLLADAQAISGIEYDISSYADIVDAIHVIQTEMGITGTTAKEASSTISGSLASMKASWQNLLTAISTDDLPFDTYVNNFVDSVATVADNLMPRIEIALGGVVKLIDRLAPVIIEKFPSLFSTLVPALINGATGMVKSLVGALPGIVNTLLNDGLPGLLTGIQSVFDSILDALPDLAQMIMDALPMLAKQLISGLTGMIKSLAKKLPSIIKPIISGIPTLVMQIVSSLLDALPDLLNGIQALFTELINMLPTLVPQLVQACVELVRMITEQLPVLLPIVIEALMSLVTLLIDQLPALLPMLVSAVLMIITLITEQIPVLLPMLVDLLNQIVQLLCEQLPVIIPMLIEATITIVMAIVEALPTILQALTDALPDILKAVWDAIVMVFTNLPQWFGQLFSGAVDIIKGIWDALKGFFSGLWDAICQIFAPVGQWFKNNFGAAWDSIMIIWNVVKPYFQGIWEGIKAVFSIVKTWFTTAFKNAWEGIKLAFSVAVDFFKTIWNNIKQVFSVVKNVLTGNFRDAWEGIKQIFSNWGSFFSGLWDKIKNTFSKIGTNIGNAISGSVKAGINGMLGVIEGVINGFLNMINGAIDLINLIPGVSISKVKLVKFTRLAEGGVVDEPTPAVFGEDGAEAVVPLENNTGWLKKVARQIHEFGLENKDDLGGLLSRRSIELQQQQVSEMQALNEKVDRITSLLVQFFPELMEALNIQMYLDGRVLVAETAAAMDIELGKIAVKKGRGR